MILEGSDGRRRKRRPRLDLGTEPTLLLLSRFQLLVVVASVRGELVVVEVLVTAVAVIVLIFAMAVGLAVAMRFLG